MTASTVELAAMPNGLVLLTGPGADEVAPGGVVPVPEVAHAVSDPVVARAASPRVPRRKSRRCSGRSVMLMRCASRFDLSVGLVVVEWVVSMARLGTAADPSGVLRF